MLQSCEAAPIRIERTGKQRKTLLYFSGSSFIKHIAPPTGTSYLFMIHLRLLLNTKEYQTIDFHSIFLSYGQWVPSTVWLPTAFFKICYFVFNRRKNYPFNNNILISNILSTL